MSDDLTSRLQARLTSRLADSLTGPLPQGTPRQVHGTIALPGKATAVIGMRRAGKTMLLHQLRRERLALGIARTRLPYVNFEDEQLLGLRGEHLHLLLEAFYRQQPDLRGSQVVTWCLDEIQVVPGWERFVRRVLDTEKVEIFLSGSSAALLSREVATAMRGRGWEVVLHPFGFGEYLAHHGQPAPADANAVDSRQRSAIEHAFLAWLTAGGFPEAQGLDPGTRHQLLQDYVDVAMLRDVIERHGVTNVTGLRWLVRHLLGNAAGSFSVQKFYDACRSQGLSIARDTVHQMAQHLDDCFLVRTVWLESDSERRRMVNPRKVYPVDPGLIPVFDRTGRANVGHALETAVLLELERRRCEVTYVKTQEGHEVDFLARHPGGGLELVQVCADALDDGTAQRELRGLVEGGRKWPRAVKRLLVLTHDRVPRAVPKGVVAQPAWEWLLVGGAADG